MHIGFWGNTFWYSLFFSKIRLVSFCSVFPTKILSAHFLLTDINTGNIIGKKWEKCVFFSKWEFLKCFPMIFFQCTISKPSCRKVLFLEKKYINVVVFNNIIIMFYYFRFFLKTSIMWYFKHKFFYVFIYSRKSIHATCCYVKRLGV